MALAWRFFTASSRRNKSNNYYNDIYIIGYWQSKLRSTEGLVLKRKKSEQYLAGALGEDETQIVLSDITSTDLLEEE